MFQIGSSYFLSWVYDFFFSFRPKIKMNIQVMNEEDVKIFVGL